MVGSKFRVGLKESRNRGKGKGSGMVRWGLMMGLGDLVNGLADMTGDLVEGMGEIELVVVGLGPRRGILQSGVVVGLVLGRGIFPTWVVVGAESFYTDF